MSAGLVSIITLVLLMLLLFYGVHLGVSLMVTSLVGVYLVTGNFITASNLLGTTAWTAIREYAFGVIPLFVLMGLFANLSGASQELYDGASLVVKKIKGGVGIATIIANAIFACITGVSIASAAVFSKIAYPQMIRLGYNKKFAVGTIGGSSILGMLLPPSLLMIVFGTQANVSIGRLFIAGIIPGIIMTIAFIIVVRIIIFIRPNMVPASGETLTPEEKANFWKVIFKPWPISILIVFTFGSIWLGLCTPTEAGGIGALGALALVFAKKKFVLKTFWDTLVSAGSTTGALLFLLVSAQMYSRALAISGITNVVERFVLSLDVPHMVIVLFFLLLLIIFAFFLDSTSVVLLTTPLMAPIISGMGMDMVWFGIIAIIAIETGLITPPFGMCVFTIKSSIDTLGPETDKVTLEDIYSGSVPYVLGMIAVMLLLVYIPILVTILPDLMLKVAI